MTIYTYNVASGQTTEPILYTGGHYVVTVGTVAGTNILIQEALLDENGQYVEDDFVTIETILDTESYHEKGFVPCSVAIRFKSTSATAKVRWAQGLGGITE
jgi:hypothetical protein